MSDSDLNVQHSLGRMEANIEALNKQIEALNKQVLTLNTVVEGLVGHRNMLIGAGFVLGVLGSGLCWVVGVVVQSHLSPVK